MNNSDTRPDGMTPYGIPIDSRYNDPKELTEMRSFAAHAAAANVQGVIDWVSYDSGSQLCTITLRNPELLDQAPGLAVLQCARKTISQFEWGGVIYHGDLLPPDEEFD